MDIFDKTGGLDIVHYLKTQDLYPYFRMLENSRCNSVEYRGQELVMMGSNNYLGLTHDPRVIEAVVGAVNKWGTSCTGSRFLNGNLEIHEQLEHELADFLGVESTLVFGCGFSTNLGTIAALCGPDDYVLSDKENHACIVEGIRLSGAKLVIYRNCNVEHLEKQLRRIPFDAAKLIITDGVFSMSGQISPYDKIYALAKKYHARTYIDDAHGLGVIGVGGRGTASHYNLPADIIMGTFSKSLASQGGFIAGRSNVLEYLRHKARTLMFSAALSPANTAAALKALQILIQEPERVALVREKSLALKAEFDSLGFNTMGTQSCIVPVWIGDDEKALAICQKLLRLGIFTTPVVFPATPKGQALIRCSVMSSHTDADLEKTISAFKKVTADILNANSNPNKKALADRLDQPSARVVVETACVN